MCRRSPAAAILTTECIEFRGVRGEEATLI